MSTSIEEKVAVLDERTKNFEKTATEIKQLISEFIKKSESQSEILPTKYAGKWVETVSIGVLVSLVAGILLFVFTNYTSNI